LRTPTTQTRRSHNPRPEKTVPLFSTQPFGEAKTTGTPTTRRNDNAINANKVSWKIRVIKFDIQKTQESYLAKAHDHHAISSFEKCEDHSDVDNGNLNYIFSIPYISNVRLFSLFTKIRILHVSRNALTDGDAPGKADMSFFVVEKRKHVG
jgi:hypothetical protein